MHAHKFTAYMIDNIILHAMEKGLQWTYCIFMFPLAIGFIFINPSMSTAYLDICERTTTKNAFLTVILLQTKLLILTMKQLCVPP